MPIHKFIVLMYAFCAFCFVLNSCSASAEDSYQVYRLPEGVRVTSHGETYQGFTLGEYKLLLRMDADLKAADTELKLRLVQVSTLQANLTDTRSLVTLTEKQLTLAQAEVERKDKAITDLTKKNIELFGKLEARKGLFRVGGGLVGALVGGVVLGFMLSK